jgi:GlpG protein
MRPIGHISDAGQAHQFSDYLAANGMATDLDREADGRFLVWVVEEEHIAEAKTALAEFVASPGAPKFLGHAGSAERKERVEEESQAAYAKRIRTRKSLMPRMTSRGVGPLTFALVGICVAVAVYSMLGSRRELLEKMFIENPDLPGFLTAVRQGEVWRLWSPIFLHFSLAHIVFNMMWLFNLGSMIEGRLGTRTLALLVFVTGLLSNLAERMSGSIHFGGMSGVVYALIGYVWIRGKYDPASGVGLDPQSRMISLVWLVVCMTGMVGPVANYAHFSGLIVGMAWGWIAASTSRRRPE